MTGPLMNLFDVTITLPPVFVESSPSVLMCATDGSTTVHPGGL